MATEAEFELAVALTLTWEGGYVCRPDDPGGETNFGISKRAYPQLDIPALTREVASHIYRTDYWGPAGCEQWPPATAIVCFDFAVNSGVRRAVGALSLLHQLRPAASDRDTALALAQARAHWYVELALSDNKQQFLVGWLNRCLANLALAVEHAQ